MPESGPLHLGFRLSADGESIALYAADGTTLIDIIPGFPLQNPNHSYGRFPDAGDTFRMFSVGSSAPTPGSSNKQGADAIVINEIMFHPYHEPEVPENYSLEFVELYNQGTDSVDLQGWQFVDGIEFSLPPVFLNPGDYLIIAADSAAFREVYPEVTNVVGDWEGRLSNQGEDIELIDAGGVLIDRVKYADRGDWAVRELGPIDHEHRGWQWSKESDGGGKSLELINCELSNDYGQNWGAALINGGKSWEVADCICKKERRLLGEGCEHPLETCLAIAPVENAFTDGFWGRPITKEEACRVLDMAEEAGLVHMTGNVQVGHMYICNCCGCSCAVLRGITELGLKGAAARSNYCAVVDEERCTGCGTCLERCQVKAIDLDDIAQVSDLCIGCGLCVTTCPTEAMSLKIRVEQETVPADEMDWFRMRAESRGSDAYKKLL